MRTQPPAARHSPVIQNRLARLDALSLPLRACILADIKKRAAHARGTAPGRRRTRTATGLVRLASAVALALLAPALLSSCSTPSPPKPPDISEADKRPINDPGALEAHRLKLQQRNERLLQGIRQQQAQLASVPARLQVLVENPMAPAQAPMSNRVYVVTFGFGEHRIDLPPEHREALVRSALQAQYIVVRGRTDGQREAPSEARVARERADATRQMLVRAGVDPNKVRVMHQPIGDHLADNASESGRALNRRVEIELYPVRPDVTILDRRGGHSA